MSLPETVDEDSPEVDEDGWTVPSAWWRQTEPFRGLGPRRSVTIDPDAAATVAELWARSGDRIIRTLDRTGSDEELVRRARLYLGTPTGLLRRAKQEFHPLGAAVLGALLAVTADWRARPKLGAVVDAWVGAHGLVFAAEAGALLPEIKAFNPAYPQMHGSSVDLIVAPAPANEVSPSYVEPLLSRLRALLAAADDITYAEVVRRLAGYRTGPLARRVATTYLLPTEQRWLDDDIAHIRSAGIVSHGLMLLLASATTAAQATAILSAAGPRAGPAGRPELVYSLAAHIGPDAAPLLARFFDTNLDAADKKRVLSVLGQLPTDTAFELLLDRLDQKYVQPVVLEAMARFPRRAMRLLAAAAGDSTGAGAKTDAAKQLLHDHAISHPDLVGSTRPALAPDAARAVDAAVATAAQLSAVPTDRLPPLLVTPPWTVRRTRAKPVVIEPVVPPSPLRLAWKPGEQDEWAETDVGRYRQTPDWSDLVSKAVSGESWAQLKTLALAPDHLVRPHLGRIKPLVSWDADVCLRRILGRFGDEAVDLVVRATFSRPTGTAEILLPIEGSEIAIRMAEWYGTSKAIRPVALRWFERHRPAAARDLVPVALGKPGKDRTLAEQALRLIERLGESDAIRTAAEIQGQVAVDAIDASLAMDPLEVLPAHMPALPAWLDVAHLPQVLVPDRTEALPPSAVEHICTMLAISEPDAIYPGIDIVRPVVDPASLAEMAWGVFERWRAAGFPSREVWVLDALGVVGDDETVRRLTPLIKVWPGESAHRRAVAGLDVLAAIGTDVALMHLHGIAEKAKSRALKSEAKDKLGDVADGLGLTPDQLADRLVPDFGLDPGGSLVLDYGGRRFRVGFDEQLRPMVADQDGARRKVLPKPAAKDDAVLAPAAYAHFQGLKKDVKAVAADQIRRFERAMVMGRRWTAAEQRALFIEHPLLWHLSRRLIWTTFDPDGAPNVDGSFRVAEDRTLADRADTEMVVADDVVGIAHPLHLGDAVTDWSEVFGDYEILQPFPQLDREVFHLTDAERSAHTLERFIGLKVSTGRILGLAHRGWEREAPLDAGMQPSAYKYLPDGVIVSIDLDPGIYIGNPMVWAEQTITGIELSDADSEPGVVDPTLTFGRLDPVTASELLRDLEGLVS